MAYITLKCKSCGADMSLNHDSKSITCKHCGSTYMLVDLIDDKDRLFSGRLTKTDMSKIIDFSESIKKGETYVYQAEYILAEESFKKAIEYSDKNYKGYFGVVKAKTHNFNKIPASEDYKEYAKLALAYVDKDNEALVKSELAKLEFLEREKKAKQKEIEHQEQLKKKHLENKRANERFFSQITSILIIFLAGIILLSIYMTQTTKKPSPNETPQKTYEVATIQDFQNVLKTDNFLNSTIIIKNDIDFGNINWSPIGTKSKPFTGTFRGNNFKLSNLKITCNRNEGESFIGFFGYTKDATITGLALDSVSINDEWEFAYQTNNNVGLICGIAENTNISKCSVFDTSSISLTHSGKTTALVGGLVGKALNSKIVYSYSNANISYTNTNATLESTSTYSIGGIVGITESITLANCYSSASITSNITCSSEQLINSYTGGLIGSCKASSEKKISTSFFAGTVESNVNASSKQVYIAGISGFGAQSSELTNNFVLYKTNSFKKDGASLEISAINFLDYSIGASYLDENDFLAEIDEIFTSSHWKKTNPLSPEIKVA